MNSRRPELFILSPNLFLIIIFLLFLQSIAFAAKTDIVILQNGDKNTGEIKELKFGKLKYSTDDAGTIMFEWDKIAYIKSVNDYDVEDEDGNRYFGSLNTDTLQKKLMVITPTDTLYVDLPLVVWITRVKDKFWSRLGLALSFGTSYTKASDIAQISFAANADYKTRIHILNLELNSITTTQPEKETSSNNNYIFSYSRVLPKKWTFGGKTGFQRNTEQGIDLRYLLSAAAGNYVIKTNFSQLAPLVGLNLNQEWLRGVDSSQTNLEGLVTIRFQTYRYDSPELSLTANLSAYPNLTPVGRVRVQGNIQLRWEVFSDFFWDLNYYDNYDSEPPEGAAKNDYGIVFSVGWSY